MAVTVPHKFKLMGERTFDQEGNDSATATIICEYDRGEELCAELMGYLVRLGSEVESRVAAARHPRYPNLEVKTCSLKGIGVPQTGSVTNFDGQTPRFEKAEINVSYTRIKSDGSQGEPDFTTITESRDTTVSIYTIPGRTFKYQTDTTFNDGFIDHEIGIPVPEMRITVSIDKWVNMPDDGRFEDEAGKVNESGITFLFNRYKKERLIYEGSNRTRIFIPGPDGVIVGAWQAQLSFRHRAESWQKILNPKGEFELVLADNKKMLKETDFKKLIPF